MENIFANYGTVITDRYIKRDKEDDLKKRLFGKVKGSLVLTGAGRVGKTTLIENLLINNNKLYIYINCARFKDKNKLYEKVVKKISKLLKEYLEDIEYYFNEFNKESDKSYAYLEFLENISMDIEEDIYIVLDEFDNAANIFDKNDFQTIRESVINSSYKTVYVFISRLRMEEIEKTIDGVSILAASISQKFLPIYYSENELSLYWSLLNKFIEVNTLLKNEYEYYSGYNPYLMDILSFNLLSLGKLEINLEIREEFEKYFRDIFKLLKKQDLIKTLFSYLYKEPILEPNKLDKIKNYGIIRNGQIFSKYFEEFLLNVYDIKDFSSIWSRVENNLKEVCKLIFKKEYGKNYIENLSNKYKNEKFFKDANYYLKEEKKNNINFDGIWIDTLSTGGMFTLIKLEWHFTQKVFKGKKEYWSEVFYNIRNIRNLFAHNREETININRDKINLAVEEIKQIEHLINRFLSKPI